MLDLFQPATRTWFAESFAAPTEAQAKAWPAIASGRNVLVVAPTGSGKTLAAFLWSLDRLAHDPVPPAQERLRVLYVSPLKALAADVERNLRAPLAGLRNVCHRLHLPPPDIRTAVRTGDTPQDERRRFGKAPPDILITTPESLFLILTSGAREALRFVDTVIVDEVHALVPTKRGAHLALSLERLDDLLERRAGGAQRSAGPAPAGHRLGARRIGLSATVNPVEEAARFLVGAGREVEVLEAEAPRPLEISVVVPVEDLAEMGTPVDEVPLGKDASGDPDRRSIWPHLGERLLEAVRAHRSTLVFANSRRLAERLCGRLNDLAGEEVARAHHGSVSREQRVAIEEGLKAGRLPAVVATSSLELGIDMGAVDLVAQVEAPPSVASGLQRVGRAGHQVGGTSRGVLYPKWRGDLLACAVTAERMRARALEPLRYPRNALDVLAQQVVAMVAVEDRTAEDLGRLVRRAAPFADLPESALEGVLDMLSGRYPSDEFAGLRARINWDRATGHLTARPGAGRLALTSGGTIPDRGLFGVFLVGDGSRVGELDEEMVFESRRGDVFALGATSWRIEEITHDRVLVTPAPGEPSRMPFWKGDAPGRPVELGRAFGRYLREISALDPPAARERLKKAGLDDWAADNLLRYLEEQREATGVLPDDRTLVVERFQDVLGDWRLCVHSPFGARVHAPWALAIADRVREESGLDVQAMPTDDGIVIRLPEAEEPPDPEVVLFDPEEIAARVTAAVGGSAMFASRFRECASRALLLPRRLPGKRNPLWLQRQRSASLLQVARAFPEFPIVLETMRECLTDVFDLPALRGLMQDLRSRAVRVQPVDTPMPSPFASALLFNYMGAFLYDGDAPLAERRAQVLAMDTALLAELLGQAELRELIDLEALQQVELELQRLAPDRGLRDADDLHDALRGLGDLSAAEVEERGGSPEWLPSLQATRRALPLRVAGEERWVAAEDASRYRDALGAPLPPGLPASFLEPAADPLADLVGRYARTHGPFHTGDAAARLGLGRAVVADTLRRLERSGRVMQGEFRPGGQGLEWCHADVLRMLRRRSLARLRREVEAVPPAALARFLPRWQGLGSARTRGLDGLLRVVEQLQGAALPASALETLVLPSRVVDYTPALLDELCSAGEVLWAGAGEVGGDDGWVRLFLADDAPSLLLPPEPSEPTPLAARVLDALGDGGAWFFRQILQRVSDGRTTDDDLVEALWELAWAGRVTNDTLAPLRLRLWGKPRRSAPLRRRPRLPTRQGPPAGAGRWSLLPAPEEPTRARLALAEQLLDRHGVLTRGVVEAEGVFGGFSAVYSVLKAMEEAGRCRRGYFVEGLGAAQFALPGAVDRLRLPEDKARRALVLAAADPANPYGAALPWPAAGEAHRPGRKAGALCVLEGGELVLFLERGFKSALTFTADPSTLDLAARALADAARAGRLGRFTLERVDGGPAAFTPLGQALKEAGFQVAWRGLRLEPAPPRVTGPGPT